SEQVTGAWADTLAEVSQPEWDRLASEGGFYLSHGWLSLQERGSSSRRSYALATVRERLVGALPVDVVEVASNDFYRFPAILPKRHPEPTAPMMLLGGRAGYAGGPVLDPDLDADRRTSTIRALLSEVTRVSREL